MSRASGRARWGTASVVAACAGLALAVIPAHAATAAAITVHVPSAAVLAKTVKCPSRTAVTAVLAAVARNKQGAARRYLRTSAAGTVLWRALRSEHAWQAGLPTTASSDGGPWRRAGQPWAKPGATRCYRSYCSVFLAINALGSDGPYATLYTRRSATKTKIVAVRDIGPQDAFDYNGAYWACTRRAVNLTNPAPGAATSKLRLRDRALVQVGSYYGQSSSDPTLGVRFSRVVEGYVATSALLRVPGAVRGEAKARAWCSASA